LAEGKNEKDRRRKKEKKGEAMGFTVRSLILVLRADLRARERGKKGKKRIADVCIPLDGRGVIVYLRSLSWLTEGKRERGKRGKRGKGRVVRRQIPLLARATRTKRRLRLFFLALVCPIVSCVVGVVRVGERKKKKRGKRAVFLWATSFFFSCG